MFGWLKNIFVKAIRAINFILATVFDAGFKLLMARLQDIATESITKLASTDLTNTQKREAAFKDIQAYALQRAITVSDSDINIIIEVFVKALKKQGVIK